MMDHVLLFPQCGVHSLKHHTRMIVVAGVLRQGRGVRNAEVIRGAR